MQQTLALLKHVADDPRNEVRSLSGIPALWLPGVGIVAENGCFTQTRETNQEDARDVDRRAGEPKFHVEKAL